MATNSVFDPTVLSGGRKDRQSPRAAYLDMIIGFFGFFALATLLWTVVAELSGDAALTPALILLLLVLALVGLFRLRRGLK
jgi:hypothetical protein